MKLSRDKTLMVHHVLDQWLPPVLRDSRIFMYPFFRLLFGRQALTFMDYRSMISDFSPEEIKKIYNKVATFNIDRDTDINSKCLDRIEGSIVGRTVLDIGCGKGYLASRLSGKYQVTGVDFVIDQKVAKAHPEVAFQEEDICSLPFCDDHFDTVICAHTLEHIPDIASAVDELRRVCRKRLIVVLPRQRPYRYTFDLHLHFFPYRHSLFAMLGGKRIKGSCSLVGGDWFYLEDSSK